ncbi:helix-turn-helix domain-containing protein [Limosilactobacillus reuteri]|uniref:Transcriptional regulator n=1 Tax=Limosilactobacillus reuteri TaxID=1598 RepID=A0A1C1Z8J7_LIMRT|nr:helix-turn-helix transcriptional regulator [Limosilactobacillus reuteri]MCT3189262.1 XRE family transcriptional regulator [Limosilactobacillus reuteri]MCT3196224.1 XRE family transcriptional regulator [Limosilactobacillus reuteri]OCW61778.1 transcriptional regulator [Limosilactobacillus reuteri]OCW62049.1 transcriptional regulator [Limosilactobacillus reuteri]OCW66435.1 transcriptional regulator [Limosilactobacillus reuteri]
MDKNVLYDRIKELADKQNLSIRRLEEKLGFGNGVINRWRKTTPGVDKIEAVANFFGVTTDYLLGRTDTPQFTRKDERDVQKILEEMTQGLNNKNELAFLKNGGQEIDPEDAELLSASLENVIRQSKLIAKQKFTPKKYRKKQD